MGLRITKVDEYQFLTCLKHGLWGSHKRRFDKWKVGEMLVFIVDKRITALVEVVGEAFYSEEEIWDNGLFPYRIPIRFIHIMSPENRIPVLGEVRDVLINAWGNNYGIGILSQSLLTGDSESIIIDQIKKQRNDLKRYKDDLKNLLQEAKQKREIEQQEKNKNKRRVRKSKKEAFNELLDYQASLEDTTEDNANVVTKEDNLDKINEVEVTIEEASSHSKAQHLLITMGKVTGCQVWIASNDRNRDFMGHPLGEGCLDTLPNFGLNKEATEKISLIDIIWIQQNSPICAFEVETTTSIYSGLLRMSDLISVVPALNIKLFIVAPRQRQEKVMKELRRPTFKKIGLNEYCKFVAIEDLEDLLDKIKGLYGHVQPSVIEKIAIEAEMD
jgi:hypothetical protein